MRSVLFFLLITTGNILQAQFYKDKCVAGNCRNGFGLMRVNTSNEPLPVNGFYGFGNYHYYLMGEFKKGKLEGKGCRFEVPWNYGNFKPADELYGAMAKDGKLPRPDSSLFRWFETGTYQNNKLHGEGYLAIYDFGLYTNGAKLVRQGQFINGKLEGNGVKIFSKLGRLYDTLTRTYSKNQVDIQNIVAGNYKNDACLQGTKSMMSVTGVWGNITGEYLDDEFLTGWVIKDFIDSAKLGNVSEGFHFKRTVPYKIMYIGGIETGNRFSTEVTETRKINLGDGRMYEGETDMTGKPFGFGEIRGPAYVYKGFVDNGQPNGYGIYYAAPIISKVFGGRFDYGKLLNSGVAYHSTGWPRTVQCFGFTKNPAPAAFNLFTGNVHNGDYLEKTYEFDAQNRKYKLIREKSGYMINGEPAETYVSVGKTNEDIKKQRKVTNGRIAFNEVVPGDVVVLDGLASLVVDNKYMRINLLDGRYISDNFQNQFVQLSRHKAEHFERTCNSCNGKAFTTSTYTPAPQEVIATHYQKETIVGDFTIYTHFVPVTTRYTKTFSPVTRKDFCKVCNGTGREKISRQMKE